MKSNHVLFAAVLAASLNAQTFDPPVAVNSSTQPGVVEVTLSAQVGTWQYKSGVDTDVWGYSDDGPGGGGLSIPGPTIVGNVGDTVNVHFTNNLPEPTTIHWHGLEIPADMDGSHIAQRWIQPGETFDYSFELLHEGLYWYHPHVRVFDQVEKGLHGCVLVHDPQRDARVFGALGGRQVEEHIIVCDDILLDANDQLVPAFSMQDPLQNATYQVNGRVGNVLLVNGRDASEVDLEVTNGAVQRWHVVNVANTTFFRLDLNTAQSSTGAPLGVDLWELGSDGGYNNVPFKRYPVARFTPTEHPAQAQVGQMGQGILLMPGERLHIAFTPVANDGDWFTVQQVDWFRGRHVAVQPGGAGTPIMLLDDTNDGFYPDVDYFRMTVHGTDPGLGAWTPDFLFEMASPTPIGNLPVMFGHMPPDPDTGDVVFFAQADMLGGGAMKPYPSWAVTSDQALDVQVGETWQWRVVNMTHGDHPFHVHGFSFELLEYEWQDDLDPTNPQLNFKHIPFARRQVKDTIRVPARLGARGTSRCIATLRVSFDDTGREGRVAAHGERATFKPDDTWISGGWLFHCHVLEHSARGMLSFFEVRDPDDHFVSLGRNYPKFSEASLTAEGDDVGPVNLHLTHVLPGSLVTLLMSNRRADLQLLAGGVMLPGVVNGSDLLMLPGVADAQGQVSWTFPDINRVMTYSQAFVNSLPAGWSISNAVERLR